MKHLIRIVTTILTVMILTTVSTFASGGSGTVQTSLVDGKLVATISGDVTVVWDGITITRSTNVVQPASGAPVSKVSGVPINNGSCTGPASDGSFVCKGGVLQRAGRIDQWSGFPFSNLSCAQLGLSGDTRTIRCEAGTDLSATDKLTWRPS